MPGGRDHRLKPPAGWRAKAPLPYPNATTIQAMKDARAGRVTKAADIEALFRDLNADA
jgi:hypothetical protein